MLAEQAEEMAEAADTEDEEADGAPLTLDAGEPEIAIAFDETDFAPAADEGADYVGGSTEPEQAEAPPAYSTLALAAGCGGR